MHFGAGRLQVGCKAPAWRVVQPEETRVSHPNEMFWSGRRLDSGEFATGIVVRVKREGSRERARVRRCRQW
jgi:hypothetical protein